MTHDGAGKPHAAAPADGVADVPFAAGGAPAGGIEAGSEREEALFHPHPGETPEQVDARWLREVYQGSHAPQLTARAVITGMVLGGVLALSNLYVGLKAGWALGVAITACIASYSLWSGLVAARLARTPLSLLESNCMQATASSAGFSTVSIMVSALPAYLILTGVRVHPLWLVAWTFFLALLGLALAVPLKRMMINREQLAFPSAIAAAQTLRGLHQRGTQALRQARALFWGMAAGAAWEFAGGNTFRWWKLPRLPQSITPGGTLLGHPLADYTIGLELSSVSMAAGALIGLRTTAWMLVGSTVNYLLVVPYLLRSGALEAVDAGLIARSFSLWAGAALMITASLTSVLLQWNVVLRGGRQLGAVFGGVLSDVRARRAGGRLARPVSGAGGDMPGTPSSDPLAGIEVPGSWSAVGVVVAGAGAVAVGKLAFGIVPWLSIVGIAFAIVVVLVACRATGETDIAPVGDMGKMVQLAYGGLARGNVATNVMGASLATTAAASGSDLLTNLKCGYLLGANPRKQFVAQALGVLVGTSVAVAAFAVLVRQPGVLGSETLPAPAARSWQVMAELCTSGVGVLGWSAKWGLLLGILFGALLPLLETAYPKRVRWFPSAFGLGLGLVLYFSNSAAMFAGSLAAWLVCARPSKGRRGVHGTGGQRAHRGGEPVGRTAGRDGGSGMDAVRIAPSQRSRAAAARPLGPARVTGDRRWRGRRRPQT